MLPRVSADLHTSDAAASATVSCVLVGIAVGQVVIGPLSDAVGRRAPLLIGAAAYALLHVLSALSTSIVMLLAVRVLAGFATAACIVVGRAWWSTCSRAPARLARSRCSAPSPSIVPVLAPVAGSLLALVMGWRGMFLVLAGARRAADRPSAGERCQSRCRPTAVRRRTSAPSCASSGRCCGCARFLAYAAAIGAVGVVLFGYIGASSFTLQGGFGLSPQQYGLVFALNSVGIFLGSNLAARLSGRVPAARLLLVGQSVLVVGVAVLAAGVGRARAGPRLRRPLPDHLEPRPGDAVVDVAGDGGLGRSCRLGRRRLRHHPVRLRRCRLATRRLPAGRRGRWSSCSAPVPWPARCCCDLLRRTAPCPCT